MTENEIENPKIDLAEPWQNRGRWMAERENRGIFGFCLKYKDVGGENRAITYRKTIKIR